MSLLPCPFCGAQAVQELSFGAFFINCTGCTAQVTGGGSGEYEEAKANNIAAWNRRFVPRVHAFSCGQRQGNLCDCGLEPR